MSYASLNLTVSSPVQSFTELLTIAEAKAYINLPERSPADSAEDTLIETFISAAREQAEILQGRDIVQKQYDLALDTFPVASIELRPHLVTVDLLKYRDSAGTYTTLAENTDYIVDTSKQPGVVLPVYGGSWPSFIAWPSSAVLVRFTCGLAATDAWWADAGKRVKTGMLHLISAWYNNRLPFETGSSAANEYPYTVTACLSYGAIPRAR